MSLLKYIERLTRMDDLIRRKATGNADEFAVKMKVSRSILMDNLRDMKALGAPIKFCTYSRSYYYESDFELVIGRRSSFLIKGGTSTPEYENILVKSDYSLLLLK